MKIFKPIFTIVTLLSSILVSAGVNIKNGNYYVTYKDIVVPGGGKDLEISRTYNSTIERVGWFGMGWASEFETRLEAGADGSVTVIEFGNGAMTRFTPKKTIDPKSATDNIIKKFKESKTLTAGAESKLRESLENDAELRRDYAVKLGVRAKLAVGTKLFSSTRGLQEIHKLKKGYKRVKQDGIEHHFNEAGQLTKIKDKYGYKIDLVYENGVLKTIKDSKAKQLYFDWYTTTPRLVKNIWSVKDKKTEYKYEDMLMVESLDVKANKYLYSYDDGQNLNSITYDDKSKLEIQYDPKTEFATYVKTRDGEETKYVYGADKKNPELHYWTDVKRKRFDGEWSNDRYEYEIKRRKDGSTYTYRVFTRVNDLSTETIYSECCGLPLKITQGKNVTTFTYDGGLLTSKVSTRGEAVYLKYHDKLKKITYVKNNQGETYFDYSQKGDLKQAKNKNSQVNLFYDRNGRIKKMINSDRATKKKQVLEFSYNNMGKPIEIKMAGIGGIKVEYDNYGSIKNVNSKEGHRMALKVTQAFQSLLAIVKPAGVNLNL